MNFIDLKKLPGFSEYYNFFYKKKILITGNTGFKGSWLSYFLSFMNCELYGYSENIPTNPSVYKILNLNRIIKTNFSKIQNYQKLNIFFNEVKPDIVFHLAAQSLVFESTQNPLNTFLTNVNGTMNLLDILKKTKIKKRISCIFVTSDKCYLPQKNKYFFKENDILGGIDPYSASKACTEILYYSYFKTFLEKKKNISSCTVRAGNVIGGGDWSKDRLIPDVIKSILKNKDILIRNPESNRPWQHVFDPVFSYITISKSLYKNKRLNGQSYNIGPNLKKNKKVIYIVKELLKKFNSKSKIKIYKKSLSETCLLNLNTSKIKKELNIKQVLDLKETIELIYRWHSKMLDKNKIKNESDYQVKYYFQKLFNKK